MICIILTIENKKNFFNLSININNKAFKFKSNFTNAKKQFMNMTSKKNKFKLPLL